MSSLIKIHDRCWTRNTQFRFMGSNLNNRLVVFRLDHCLIACNGVELDDDLKRELYQLQDEQKVPFKYLFSPGDWHHLYLSMWQDDDNFSSLKVVAPRGRINRVNPKLHCIWLDEIDSEVSSLRDEFQVISFEGLRQPTSNKNRNELYFYHKDSKVLTTGDTVVKYHPETPLLSDRIFLKGKSQSFSWNPTGKFMIKDKGKAIQSCKTILDLDFHTVIPPHGVDEGICYKNAKMKLKECFESVLGIV